MEFGSENEVVDSRALKILGQSEKITTHIGERRIAEFRCDKSAALDANFEAVQVGGDGAQGFVGAIEALQQARVLPVIETRGTQQQVERAKRANEVQQQGLGLRQ